MRTPKDSELQTAIAWLECNEGDGEEEAADAQEEAGAEQERDAQNKYADDFAALAVNVGLICGF